MEGKYIYCCGDWRAVRGFLRRFSIFWNNIFTALQPSIQFPSSTRMKDSRSGFARRYMDGPPCAWSWNHRLLTHIFGRFQSILQTLQLQEVVLRLVLPGPSLLGELVRLLRDEGQLHRRGRELLNRHLESDYEFQVKSPPFFLFKTDLSFLLHEHDTAGERSNLRMKSSGKLSNYPTKFVFMWIFNCLVANQTRIKPLHPSPCTPCPFPPGCSPPRSASQSASPSLPQTWSPVSQCQKNWEVLSEKLGT